MKFMVRRRIKKAKFLEPNSRKDKTKKVNSSPEDFDKKSFRDVHINIGSIKISKGDKIGIVIGIISAGVALIGIYLSL